MATILTDSDLWQSLTWRRASRTVYWFGTPRWTNHPVLLVLRLLLHRRGYDVVLTTGTKATVLYGLACRLLGLRQKQIVQQLYLFEPAGFLPRLLQERLTKLVLGGVDGVIVTSRAEMPLVESRFGVPLSRQRFVPYHAGRMHLEDTGCAEGYVFSAGRNQRDYSTLLRAVEALGVSTVIVCGAGQLDGMVVPDNVTVLTDIPWSEYDRWLRGAAIVVMPLVWIGVPAGQMVLLEATSLGKPVIASDQPGTVDYVTDGVDGLLYPMGDAAGLERRIAALQEDPAQRRRIGRGGYERALRESTFEAHGAQRLRAVEELTGTASSGGARSEFAEGITGAVAAG